MFVTIEGVEGSGKSTLLSHLADRLRADGRTVLVTREPGGTSLGNAIRALFLHNDMAIAPVAEAFLIGAARAQHVSEVIRPALDRGEIVLCDRFLDSTLAYQGYGRGLDLVMLRELSMTAADALVPDLTFVLDVPTSVSAQRQADRGASPDRMEREAGDFHERVREGFLALAMGGSHYRVLDGRADANAVAERAYTYLNEVL